MNLIFVAILSGINFALNVGNEPSDITLRWFYTVIITRHIVLHIRALESK